MRRGAPPLLGEDRYRDFLPAQVQHSTSAAIAARNAASSLLPSVLEITIQRRLWRG